MEKLLSVGSPILPHTVTLIKTNVKGLPIITGAEELRIRDPILNLEKIGRNFTFNREGSWSFLFRYPRYSRDIIVILNFHGCHQSPLCDLLRQFYSTATLHKHKNPDVSLPSVLRVVSRWFVPPKQVLRDSFGVGVDGVSIGAQLLKYFFFSIGLFYTSLDPVSLSTRTT